MPVLRSHLQENQKFRVSIGYSLTLRPSWATWDFLSKRFVYLFIYTFWWCKSWLTRICSNPRKYSLVILFARTFIFQWKGQVSQVHICAWVCPLHYLWRFYGSNLIPPYVSEEERVGWVFHCISPNNMKCGFVFPFCPKRRMLTIPLLHMEGPGSCRRNTASVFFTISSLWVDTARTSSCHSGHLTPSSAMQVSVVSCTMMLESVCLC